MTLMELGITGPLQVVVVVVLSIGMPPRSTLYGPSSVVLDDIGSGNNTVYGNNAYNTAHGSYDVAIGGMSMNNTTTSGYNSVIGYRAGENLGGNHNSVLGYWAGGVVLGDF